MPETFFLPPWQAILVAYALCFFIQQKLTFLEGRFHLLDRMLECTFCIGFHAGWLTWLLIWAMVGNPPGGYLSVVVWALTSATACYILNTVLYWFEGAF